MNLASRLLLTLLVTSLVTGTFAFPSVGLHLNKRVGLHVYAPIKADVVKAIEIYLVDFYEVWVQIWRPEPNSTTMYNLIWQKNITLPRYYGRHTENLEDDEFFSPSKDDRLGIYTQKDPSAATHTVRRVPYSMFSSTSLHKIPDIGDNVTFDELKFAYEFQVKLCPYPDCLKEKLYNQIQRTLTLPQIDNRTSKRDSAVQDPAPVVSVTSRFLEEDFIVGLLIWLLCLSFSVLILFGILTCRFLRERDTNPPPSPQGSDFYVIVDEPHLETKPASTIKDQEAEGETEQKTNAKQQGEVAAEAADEEAPEPSSSAEHTN